MKKINLIIAVLTAFTVVFLSCNTKVNCPKLEEKVLDWFPYQDNDVIELYSNFCDSTIIFTIKYAVMDHTTHYTKGTKCGGCSDEIHINGSNFSISIGLNDNKITHQRYSVFDTYFAEYNSNYSELKNYLFEGKEYDVVRIFEKNDSKETFKKLIIAKDFGIIGLIDNNDNTWILKVDKKMKSLKQKKMKINNTSC